MTGRAQGLIVMLAGLVAFRLVVTGQYDDYVRAGMRVPLLAASGFLIVVGVGTAFGQAWIEDRRDAGLADVGETHDHPHRPLIGWLLVLPLAVLIIVAPAPLGADAASRQDAYTSTVGRTRFPPLNPPRGGAVHLRLAEFVDRALWDAARSLEGTVVRLEGFVTHDPDVDGFVLTRFQISCCAADAVPIEVVVTAPPANPPDDEWLAVTGMLVPPPDFEPDAATYPRVEMTAQVIDEIPEPDTPYE